MKGTGNVVEMIISEDLSEQAGCEAILRTLDQNLAINGLYCVSDSLALGAYHALNTRKRAIPRQIAIIGVGDSESSPYYAPPLTCVGVPHALLHETAAKQLMTHLNTRNRINLKTSLDPVVILRESTGTIQAQQTSTHH